MDDLYDLPPNLQPTPLTDQLEKHWFDQVQRHPQSPSLIKATLRTIGWKLFLIGFIELCNVSFFFSPSCARRITREEIRHFSRDYFVFFSQSY